eukprot:TRINITY_DN2762_c0_g1_i30.p1 TRINITY_DN2762_c0_g1~~TRINITY_DN2762_c0_g1_i30.p1  ORF type:complete len:115 (+),score=11.29 TRINITY_DN2762_c0_g1_i30:159-503(+)
MGDLIQGIDNTVLVLCFMIVGTVILAMIYYSSQHASSIASYQRPQPPLRLNTEQYLCSYSSCPICLENITNEVETNCGHAFCFVCVTQLWISKNYQQLNCPYCRRKITLFFEYL